MFQRANAASLDECFLPVSKRQQRGVFFLRVTQYNAKAADWIWKYHEAARVKGVILENRIQNPDERQLGYYMETMGADFRADASFIQSALAKWMPRMKADARAQFAQALCVQLTELRRQGKSEGIQKNVYIKLMCWLYYKFERLVPFLGEDDPPKILYEGSEISAHELILLRMLMALGADVVLLETRSDAAYLKLDAISAYSQLLNTPASGPFPGDFCLKNFRKERMRPANPTPVRQTGPVNPAPVRTAAPRGIDVIGRLTAPSKSMCTNAWMTKAEWQQILTPYVLRGGDAKFFYNAFIRVNGAPDKLTYVNELYQFYRQLESDKRRVCIMEGPLKVPSPEEVQKIRRRSYRSTDEMMLDLLGNIPASASIELQRTMQLAFVRVMQQAQKQEENINRLTTTAVYLLCWIQRYQDSIFRGWREETMPCVIKMGGCETEREALYMLYLSQLPVDVLIMAPNLNQPCVLHSEQLFEISGTDSLPLMPFPKQSGSLTMQTVASYAEGDLSSALYGDSGLYRNRQFGHAEAITLQTTFDEIFILWEQELKYRPNFSAEQQSVNIPVLYAKISGVEEGKMLPYWQKAKLLVSSADTLLFKGFPLAADGGNSYQVVAAKCLKDGRIRRDELMADRRYPFGLLRAEMQAHMLDKMQWMLDEKVIRGTFQNGTEYTVVSTVLNMPKEFLRLIQNFDFTKRNPKLVVISTREQRATLQDAILLTFLNRIGFDIVLLVPTGYQTVEAYLNDCCPIEHQIGTFVYDQEIPDFASLPSPKGLQRLNQFLRRRI